MRNRRVDTKNVLKYSNRTLRLRDSLKNVRYLQTANGQYVLVFAIQTDMNILFTIQFNRSFEFFHKRSDHVHTADILIIKNLTNTNNYDWLHC